MNIKTDQRAAAEATPLEEIDVSLPERFQNDTWLPWFARLRRDAPVHYLADSANGVHRCMGNRLAEMQLRVLWEEIVRRFHSVELVGDVKRLPNNFIRGIADVPVVLHPH